MPARSSESAAESVVSRPPVSVVMPVRNEADFIEESLGAVLAQDYPAELMEVLVADGMSNDGTREAVQRLSNNPRGIPVTLVDNPGRIVPTGLNLVLARARGDVVVRVDGHCRIAPDYVGRCVAHLQESGVDGVGGLIRTVAKTPVGQAIAAAMSSSFGVGPSSFRTVKEGTRLSDTVPFPAYTRATLKRAGPYDEGLTRNQDDEYNYRIRKWGGRLLLASDVKADYYSRGSLRSLWRQYFQYGFYKVAVMRKHPRQMHPRQFAPPAFALGLVAAPIAAAISVRLALVAALVIAAYAAAVIAMAARISAREGWHLFPFLVSAFPILHVGYGLGFLAGCTQFHRFLRSRPRNDF
jgi:succinoglycan biosynthesis protein ExoA